jgi:hypothetical protein
VPVITVTYLKNKLKSKKGLRHGSNGRVFVEYTQGPEFKLRIQKTMRRRRRRRKKERRKKREEEEKIQKKEKEGEEKREQWIDTKEESGCTRTQGNGQGKSQNLAAQGHKEMGREEPGSRGVSEMGGETVYLFTGRNDPRRRKDW